MKRAPVSVIHNQVSSPAGAIEWLVAGERLVALGFVPQFDWLRARLQERFGAIELRAGRSVAVERALAAYLAGELDALDALEIDPGGTPFERQVWAALRQIPAGATTSYGELAATLGRPTAVRAVAGANARNRIALVIPCHRVIGKGGDLRGYAGGLPRKAWLLDHEARYAASRPGRAASSAAESDPSA